MSHCKAPLEHVVKIKGLPFRASALDVRRFFDDAGGLGSAIKQDGISFVLHADGRPTGMAFIVFDGLDEARRATQKDRETFGDKFGDRYVRVYPALATDEAEMQQAVLQQNMGPQGNGHGPGLSDSVVKIKSLPFDANQLDIIQFFEGFRLKPNGVQLVVRSDNKPTGEAFVDFEAPDEAARAIKEKDHKVFSDKFGDRYVRLIQVSRKEMQATLALRFGGEGILKIKGIPFKAQAADIRKFFGAYKIKPDGISFIMHVDGRPTGMAFIEFETPQEAVRAMEKDRAKFGPEYGDRFCMLQLVGRHEMDKCQLQRESDINNPNKVLNGINILHAAAIATQAALNNPALRPFMQAQAQAAQAQGQVPQPAQAPLQQPTNTLGLLSSPLTPTITQAAALRMGLLGPAQTTSATLPLTASEQLASGQLTMGSQAIPLTLPLTAALPVSQPSAAAVTAAAASTAPMLDAQLAQLHLGAQIPLDSIPASNPLLFYNQAPVQDFSRGLTGALPEPYLTAAASRPAGAFPGHAAAI
mmetsp:Transcript_19521/g.50730  ORF Transcript_19521/g.50730 Transcript_19521/m.50730 type:complete len:528 (+) Transcript_19521:90-1673(+)